MRCAGAGGLDQVYFAGSTRAGCGVACPNICGEDVNTACVELAGEQCVVGYQCPIGQVRQGIPDAVSMPAHIHGQMHSTSQRVPIEVSCTNAAV